jgi:hypothetical protein
MPEQLSDREWRRVPVGMNRFCRLFRLRRLTMSVGASHSKTARSDTDKSAKRRRSRRRPWKSA